MLWSKLLVGNIDMVSDNFSDVISPILRGEQICNSFFSSAHDQIPTHKKRHADFSYCVTACHSLPSQKYMVICQPKDIKIELMFSASL